MGQKYENNIRRSRERLEPRPDPPKEGNNFVFIGWGGVLGAKVVVRKEK